MSLSQGWSSAIDFHHDPKILKNWNIFQTMLLQFWSKCEHILLSPLTFSFIFQPFNTRYSSSPINASAATARPTVKNRSHLALADPSGRGDSCSSLPPASKLWHSEIYWMEKCHMNKIDCYHCYYYYVLSNWDLRSCLYQACRKNAYKNKQFRIKVWKKNEL